MNRPRPRPRTPTPPPPPRRSVAVPLVALVLALVVVLGVVAVVATRGDDDDGGTAADTGLVQTAPVEVDGAPLARFPDGGSDPAVGAPAPTLRGVSFDGTPVEIAPDGKARLVVFVAHWCPHCRAEVPVLVDWMAEGRVPEGAEVVAVATGTTPSQANYPPSAWLAREGWPAPVLVDSTTFDAATAYGLRSYPYLVAVDGDGTVTARTSGELTTDQLDALVRTATG